MSDLSGKTAFVANADSVIGQACCARLAKAGASVCASHGSGTSVTGVDLAIEVTTTESQSWDEAYKACVNQFGRLDVLVIPTIGESSKPIEKLTVDSFVTIHRAMAVPAFFAQSRGILAMRDAGNGGAVIHVLPAAARAAVDGAVAACTASAGILFSSKSAALECAKAKDGIVVNTVLVGPVAGTPPLPYPETIKAISPQSVAESVLFYATDGAAYMSGMDLPVDDGLLAQ